MFRLLLSNFQAVSNYIQRKMYKLHVSHNGRGFIFLPSWPWWRPLLWLCVSLLKQYIADISVYPSLGNLACHRSRSIPKRVLQSVQSSPFSFPYGHQVAAYISLLVFSFFLSIFPSVTGVIRQFLRGLCSIQFALLRFIACGMSQMWPEDLK